MKVKKCNLLSVGLNLERILLCGSSHRNIKARGLKGLEVLEYLFKICMLIHL